MPHYQDGTPAAVGDRVRGTTYNQPEVITGTVAAITSDAAACNAVVQLDGGKPYPHDGACGQDWDYTATADLTLLED